LCFPCSYNPDKYSGRDYEDDKNMEAGFASIEMEERRRYFLVLATRPSSDSTGFGGDVFFPTQY
jgi:hypothetical protein